MANEDTVLTLTGIGFGRWTARAIQETLRPVELGELRRDINGTLVDLTDADLHRRYAISITGDDNYPLPMDQIWRGKEVTVGCVTELGVPATFAAGVASNVVIGRTPVTGSGRALLGTAQSTTVTFAYNTGLDTYRATADMNDVSLSGAGFIYYRPSIVCLVTGWNLASDEWPHGHGWSIDLEEKAAP